MNVGRSATPPAPASLRDLARQYVQVAAHETATEIKRRLASHAFALAQLAERIERGTQMATFATAANVERYRRMLLLGLDERERLVIEALLLEEQSRPESRPF
jgi:hypothetical protein